MSGPRDEEVWRRAAGVPARPGRLFFVLLALACLVLGVLVSAWALRLL